MKPYDEVARDVFRRREAYFTEKKRRTHRRVVTGFTAAAIIIGMCGVCYAVAVGLGAADWFKSFFGGITGQKLTGGQQQYIDGTAVALSQSATWEGVTVTLRSAVADNTTAYIRLDIEAPEDTDLGIGSLYFDLNLTCAGTEEGSGGCGAEWRPLDDGDGKENTASMVLVLTQQNAARAGSEFSLADGQERVLCLRDLTAYTDDPGTDGRVLIAPGEWRFAVTFSQAPGEVEVISDPVTCPAERLMGDIVEVEITSLRLDSLGAVYHYRFPEGERPEALDFRCVEIVMKDGSVVNSYPKEGSCIHPNEEEPPICYCTYTHETPISLEEVDHLILAGKIVIPMPAG